MQSRAFSQNQSPSQDGEEAEKGPVYRRATVYDAVAGRISSAGFIPKHVVISSTRDTSSSSLTAAPPETTLFKRKNAPTRYAEADIYFANERVSPAELPDSDLLKALHCYTSDFYAHATADRGSGDWRSLDETALLGLGILMEEVTRHALGQTGDLVLTEGEEIPVEDFAIKGKSFAAPSKVTTSNRRAKRRRLEDECIVDE